MKNRILFNILTCNRFFYFKNCFESIVKFVDLDRVKILVCDAHTVESGFDEYLQKISVKYGDIVEVKKFDDRVPGEVYRSMNYAIEYAWSNSIEIVNFVQDDYQYVFKNDKHLDDVEEIFSDHRHCVQAQANFTWGKKRKGTGKLKPIGVNGTKHVILLDKVLCDNGFTRASIYKKIGLYPEQSSFKKGDTNKIVGEVWLARMGRKNKWQRSISLFPNIAMCYDVPYVRGNKIYGEYFSPPGEYYIKAFNKSDIEIVRANHDKGRFSYIEDICRCDGWEPTVMYKRNDATTVVREIA